MSQVKDIMDGIKHRLPDRANIYPSLNRAVRTISKRLRLHDVSMIRGSLSVTIAAGASSGSLPSDYWGLIGKPYLSGKDTFLNPIPDQRYKLVYDSTSIPLYYEIAGTTISLYPGYTAGGTVMGMYWTRPTALTSPMDTMPFSELFDDAIQEALILTFSGDIQAIEGVLYSAVDAIAPYLDKPAPTRTPDALGLGYLTNEYDN